MVFALPVVSEPCPATPRRGSLRSPGGCRLPAGSLRRRRPRAFESHPGIAAGPSSQLEDQARIERGLLVARPRCGSMERPLEDPGDVFGGQGLKDSDPAARKNGGVDLEGRVFRCRADQGDRAILDGAQEGVLLCLVEAMDFVDEENRSPTAALALAGFVDRGSNVLDAGKHGGKCDEIGTVVRGDQPRQGCLSRARRAPEDQRRQVAGPAQGRSQEGFLTD